MASPGTAAENGAVADSTAFRDSVLDGLSRPQKRVPSTYLYDAEGSRLFQRITRLPEYYLTRTELSILGGARRNLADLIGPRAVLIEYGAGSLEKVRVLLEAMEAPAAVVPIDISEQHLMDASARLARAFPSVRVVPVVADFTLPLERTLLARAPAGKPVAFFPGSTIGNFSRRRASAFLAAVAALVGKGGDLLIGVDLRKDRHLLHSAYNDHTGVTAAFNRNLLVRINRELDGNFEPSRFHHHAPYREAEGRVEMHLVSQGAQRVDVAGRPFAFRDGESIHTEDSCKYEVEEFLTMARASGFEPARTWTDAARLFSVHYLRAA